MPAFEPVVFTKESIKKENHNKEKTKEIYEIKAYLMMLEDILLDKLSNLNSNQ